MNTKIIANYLPQFHQIPENDLWWGKGYTDWTAVRNSVPIFEGHRQPRVPMEGYYDLSNKDAIKRQAELANVYGIDGFGIYHYYFSNEQQLLTEPAEIILNNKDIHINYMFIWDNASWKKTWSKVSFSNDWSPLYENNSDNQLVRSDGILAELIYGGEKEWKIHFEFLLPYFKDSRYIKIDDRPVFVIFGQTNGHKILHKMISFWNKLAQENGFSGIFFIGKTNPRYVHICDEEFKYQPTWDGWGNRTLLSLAKNKFLRKQHYYDYDKIWSNILKNAEKDAQKKINFGAFVDYDDSPRRGENGTMVLGATPEKFERYFAKLLKISNENHKNFVFLTAWNEWGEGAYLEPDTDYKFAYLEAVRNAVKKSQSETVSGSIEGT